MLYFTALLQRKAKPKYFQKYFEYCLNKGLNSEIEFFDKRAWPCADLELNTQVPEGASC